MRDTFIKEIFSRSIDTIGLNGDIILADVLIEDDIEPDKDEEAEAKSQNRKSIAARLRKLREAAGLTVQQLAKRAALSRQAVQHIEAGKRKNPGIETMRALCLGLGVSLAVFDAPRPRKR